MRARWKYLTEDQQAAFGNGCGPERFHQWIPEFTFNKACRKHDFHYRIYGPVHRKLWYDVVMLFDCIKSAAEQPLVFVPLAIIAVVYFIYMVIATPWYVWQARKITGCQARTMEEMAERYGFTVDVNHVCDVIGRR